MCLLCSERQLESRNEQFSVFISPLMGYLSQAFKLKVMKHLLKKPINWPSCQAVCRKWYPPQELQLLCGVQFAVSIKRGPKKEQWWTNDEVMDSQGSKMYMGREGCACVTCCCSCNLMLVLIERCQNTQFIAVCCVRGYIFADQSGGWYVACYDESCFLWRHMKGVFAIIYLFFFKIFLCKSQNTEGL